MTKYFILFSVLFFGCYESDYPISDDQVDVSETDSLETVYHCWTPDCSTECLSNGFEGGRCGPTIIYYGDRTSITDPICHCF